ncbi:MAG: RNA 2',3'-cyclic phosphodiesterase [Ponticaulis sp.]|nr:RNA 2',3'-cyclic phosphodiesterase [Ponticaulis sp.]|tara:strand:+ start:26677 stop:27213 length:537 start_codon:yes stop_codon:yes gene_type:complete
MNYRLFAALEIPEEIGEDLLVICEKVTGASWRPIDNFHITLRFFGELDGTDARELDHELGLISAKQMKLTLKGAGWFGSSEPHALWAGVEPNDALTSLASKCERAARRIGLPKEKRGFRPHVTLAYLHGTPLSEAASFCQKHALLNLGPFWVDRFHLYSSWSGKGPSRYVSEAEYPLG